jgi:hypothetical protein
MPEHFNKQTVEATVWCNKCRKPTPHRIDDGRRGPCLTCIRKPLPEPARLPAKQEELFQ